MAVKKSKATAAANSAAPAVDQAGDVSTSSAVGQEAGTAPAAGVVNESTQGAGDAGGESGGSEPGADPAAAGAAGSGAAGEGSDQGAGEAGAGEGEPGGESGGGSEGAGGEGGDTAESTVSGESGNAPTLQDANAPTSESANDQAGDGDADGAPETAQTPAENGPSSPVILGAWSLPAISEYPATLTLTNHTPSRVVVLGKGIPVDGSIQLEVTEEQYFKLAKSLRGPAQLDKWDNVRGLQVAYDPQN